MLKVMIVDDEMLIRKRIAYGFDWAGLGYQIEDEAENGIEALALMELNHYDVAIVDIAMPGMNGMELTRQVRRLNYPIEIIVLTGHSDFTYARQSLQNGVFDYILKPIHEPEFIDTLKRLHQKISQDKQRKDLLEQLSNRKEHMDTVLQAKVFSDFFHDIASTDAESSVWTVLAGAGILKQQPYILTLFHIEAFIKKDLELGERVEQFYLVAGKVFQDLNYLAVCDIYEDYVAVIAGYQESLSEEQFQQIVSTALRLLAEHTAGSIQCGISMVHQNPVSLGKAYREAFSAINNAVVLKRQVLSYREVKERHHVYFKVSYPQVKELQHHIGRNDFAACSQLIRAVFAEMEEKAISFESIILNINRLFMELVDACVISELDVHQFFKGYQGIEQALSNMADIEEMAEWCENVIYNLMETEIRGSISSKSLPIVEKACEYIRNHYQDPELNQGQIAGELAVTTSYISGVFKKAMEITMIQYITMVRMEKARQLLLEQSLEVKTVAAQTGYHDEYYFSRCFKKQYGLSPMQVRKLSDTRRLRNEI